MADRLHELQQQVQAVAAGQAFASSMDYAAPGRPEPKVGRELGDSSDKAQRCTEWVRRAASSGGAWRQSCPDEAVL
jgi:hypothetical protein